MDLFRERSRSDSDMSPKEERMDTSVHSTISVPASTSRRLSATGQFKKRLLQKYQEEEEKRPMKRSSSSPPPSATVSSNFYYMMVSTCRNLITRRLTSEVSVE